MRPIVNTSALKMNETKYASYISYEKVAVHFGEICWEYMLHKVSRAIHNILLVLCSMLHSNLFFVVDISMKCIGIYIS